MDAARDLSLHEDPPAEAPTRASPVMEQYIEIKAANPDSLLFYRMGDFYELFFEDAEVASRALGIVLTKRGKHLGRDIPMCGVMMFFGSLAISSWLRSGLIASASLMSEWSRVSCSIAPSRMR